MKKIILLVLFFISYIPGHAQEYITIGLLMGLNLNFQSSTPFKESNSMSNLVFGGRVNLQFNRNFELHCNTVVDNNKKESLTSHQRADTNGAVVGDWLIIREMADPEMLNPIVSNDASADEIDSYIYEQLADQDPISYEMVPGLAEKPEISQDFLSFTYKIKQGATFSDGHQLDAEDVIFSLKAIKNPYADDAALRNYFETVKSAEIVNGDKSVVKFTLTKPNWRGIYILGTFRICPKHILDPQGLNDKLSWDDLKDFTSASKNPNVQKFADFLNSQEVSSNAKYLVGSGPYIFESWTPNSQIILKRNPNYWNINNVPNYLEKIIFKTISDNNATVEALKRNEIDVAYIIKPDQFYKTFEDPNQFNLIKGMPYEPSYSYLAWNENNVLFKDKKVRLALAHIVDRESIIEKVLYGSAEPIQSHIFFMNKKLLNTDLPPIDFNPDKAKQLLKEAGWKDTDGDGVLDKVIDGKKVDFKFTFLSNNNPVRKQIILIIIDALKKVGIQAELQDLEWSVYLDKTGKHQFDATYASWTSPTTPPDPFQIFHSSQTDGSNYISFKNAENDKIIEQYRDELDENKRIDLIKKWQQLIYDEQPYTFLWSPVARYIVNKRFRNVNWYNYYPSPKYNEWWVDKAEQKYGK